jgi:hypothetical protein
MKSYKPQCSIPAHIDGFLSSPDIRSTMDIVWTCVATLLLCTWSILHLNVPIEVRSNSASQNICRNMYLTARKLWWMFITLMAPEIILGKALSDLVSARRTSAEMAQYVREDGVAWTLTHTFLANMGGFAIEFGEDEEALVEINMATLSANEKRTVAPDGDKTVPTSEAEANDVLQKFYHARMAKSRFKYGLNIWKQWPMGVPRWRLHPRNARLAKEAALASRAVDVGVHKPTSYCCNIMALRGHVWILDARQLLTARSRGLVVSLPRLTEDDINDRSKSDALVKAITAFNVLWLVVQLIVRAAQHLPVTQLEIVTLSFALCSLATYMMLLNKPQDIGTRIHIRAARHPTVDDFKALAYLGPETFWYVRAETWVPDASAHYLDVSNIKWLRFLSHHSSLQVSIIATLAISIPFGAVHLIAWNFEFPTQAERLVWHIACLVTIGVPFFIAAAMLYGADFLQKVLKWSFSRAKSVVGFHLGVMLAVQGILRGFVLIEALRSLAYQPAGAFQDTDIKEVLHLG